jgi:RNA polymerase sigma-70 factor, ECF subfamily
VTAAPLDSAVAATDAESRAWVRDLRAENASTEATARLHALLLHAARFEVARRSVELALTPDESAEIAIEAADDALVEIRAHLGDFTGDRRFTTWARKFALLAASVKVRRRAWQGRELPREEDELVGAVGTAIAELLTPAERTVVVALAVNRVPIDVLAERRDTTRGDLYELLRAARRKLRQGLAGRVLTVN